MLHARLATTGKHHQTWNDRVAAGISLTFGSCGTMETRNLASASEYVNNLLLARGLLRNGKSIDFANQAGESGDPEETIARTINLVHDLIVRRDVRRPVSCHK